LSREGVKVLRLGPESLPKDLESTTFGLAPCEISHGLPGLTELLDRCKSLETIRIFPQSESAETPIELCLTPSAFSGDQDFFKLTTRRLQSFFFHVPSSAEWRHLERVLTEMPKLEELWLLIDAIVEESEEHAPTHDNIDLSLTLSLTSLHLRISNSDSLTYLRRCLATPWWRKAAKVFDLSIPAGEILCHDVDFFGLLVDIPRGVEELLLYFSPLTIRPYPVDLTLDQQGSCPEEQDVPQSIDLNLSKLILPAVTFEVGGFSRLINSFAHSLRILRLGDAKDFCSFNLQSSYTRVSGLKVTDLCLIKQLKNLVDCLLFVDIDIADLANYEQVSASLMTPLEPKFDYRLSGVTAFREAFVRLSDDGWLRDNIAEWKAGLAELLTFEVVAAIAHPPTDHLRFSHRPLIFASRCPLGKLHFTIGS